MITSDQVYERLRKVIDPETQLNVVDMGLIYEVEVRKKDGRPFLEVLYTLTTPGCPLMGTFQSMMTESLRDITPDFSPERDLNLELTFDPPWTRDLLSEEARAELGL